MTRRLGGVRSTVQRIGLTDRFGEEAEWPALDVDGYARQLGSDGGIG